MTVKIFAHPIRHKERLKELEAQFKRDGVDIEIIYKNTNHIRIRNENREGKDKQGKNES